MENKLKSYLSNKLIFELLVVSNLITIEDSYPTAITLFNELNKKHKYLAMFRELSRLDNHRIQTVIEEIKSLSHKSMVSKKPFDINMLKIILRSHIAEAKKQKEEILSSNKELQEIEEIKSQIGLTPMKFTDFMDTVEQKKYYVKQMFANGTINMIFSPPKQMKSFVSYYLALCLATGSNFLNQKTKKVPICYFDWENPISDVQNRINGICKGMQFNKKEIDNFYFFPRQPTLIGVDKYGGYVYEELKTQLIDFIKENEIKVIFFDTFRRIGNFDENDSRTINTIKSELFDPLINETDVCIIFLHHTSKEGKTYRGSVDIEGILDTSFKVTKKEREDHIAIKIKCDARRNNEIDLISSNVEIENISIEDDDGEMIEIIDSVVFKRSEDNEITEKAHDYSIYRKYLIDNLDIGTKYRNKELKSKFEEHFEIKSEKTISQILKWAVKIKILIKTGTYKNTRYQINPEKKEKLDFTHINPTKTPNSTKEIIINYLHEQFKTLDVLLLKRIMNSKEQNLDGLFSEKYLAPILNDWIAKGWLNTARSGEIAITEKYKMENRK